GGGQSGRPAADDGDVLPGALQRRRRVDPALLEAPVDDAALDRLDRDRRFVDAQRARAFAGGRTDAPGELGKVVGLVQSIERLAPVVVIDQVVPLGDEVMDGAAGRRAGEDIAGVAEGNAAVHAPRALLLQDLQRDRLGELVPVADPLPRITLVRRLPAIL